MSWFDRLLGTELPPLPPPTEAKAITVSLSGDTLEPGGFVNELRSFGGLARLQSDTSSLQSVQLRNELVYACIDTKATAALDPQLVVQQQVTRKGKTTYETLDAHPMRQLLVRPNPDMTEVDLMKAAIVSWDVSNPRRFFCEKVTKGSILTELWPLDPSQMKPLPSRTNSQEQIGYVWGNGANRKEYSFDDLLIRRAPAWYDPPPLISALGATESDSAQTDYIRSFFENGGIPPGILKYNMPLRQEQRDEIRDRWRMAYGNRLGRQHDIGVLDTNVEYQKTGSNLDELASQTLRSVAESRICMVFKVPPLIVYAYVGLIRATYSNLSEAWAGFWDATMSPQFKEWRVFWQWALLSEFENEVDIRSGRIRLDYDMSRVSALQDDVDLIQKRARDNYQAGGISLNEYRTAIGSDPVPGGDDLYVAKPMTSIAGMSTPAPIAPALAVLPAAPAMPMDAPTDTPKGRKDRSATTVQLIERRMESALKAYLAGEYGKGGLSGLDDGSALVTVMKRFYPQLIENAFDHAKHDGVLVHFSLEMEEVQDVLDKLAKEIVNVSDTTRSEVQRLVGLQAENGWSAAELAQQIRQLSETRSPIRALTIARTESGTAYNLGAVTAYRAGGVTHVTVLDGDEDEPCASANGSTWTLEQAEANPLGHPNCTRAFSPVVGG
jgi:HK97 family phage portal protein